VKRCDAILGTAFVGIVLGALAGVVLADGPVQLLVYAVAGVWGGALAGGLVGACVSALKLREQDGSARRDLAVEPAKKLRPAGL
jgi:hypothetical protein